MEKKKVIFLSIIFLIVFFIFIQMFVGGTCRLFPCIFGECYKFPNKNLPRCSLNPCNVCDSKKCIILESWPGIVVCKD